MIPGRLIRFLEEHANVAMAGTRRRDLVPNGHRVSGWRVNGDQRTVSAFIAEQFTDNLVDSLQDNGEFALTVEEYPSHETYQLKGRYVRHRSIEPEDTAAVIRIRDRFVRSLKPLYPYAPDGVLSSFTLKPVVAVEFEVREIYLQTPGPGAGARLVPPADA